jgi:HlyD family secretion protein
MQTRYERWQVSKAVLCVIALGACSHSDPDSMEGYVEGDYLYLAAPQAGYLQALAAVRGSRVTAGTQVFAIAPDPDDRGLAEAQARTQSAQAKLENLKAPRREAEITAQQASERAGQAALALAESQLRQQTSLLAKGFVSSARVDEARSARDQAAAQLAALQSQIALSRNSVGRPGELRAAQADVTAAASIADQKQWLLSKKSVNAPAAGVIAETYFQPGEWVSAGAPVASLLPDTQRHIRFFVPQARVATLSLNQTIEARCDGCAEPIRAHIDFIASEAEYTPPVIYSRNSRAKLVFRVEAVPALNDAAKLPPGVPVDIRVLR